MLEALGVLVLAALEVPQSSEAASEQASVGRGACSGPHGDEFLPPHVETLRDRLVGGQLLGSRSLRGGRRLRGERALLGHAIRLEAGNDAGRGSAPARPGARTWPPRASSRQPPRLRPPYRRREKTGAPARAALRAPPHRGRLAAPPSAPCLGGGTQWAPSRVLDAACVKNMSPFFDTSACDRTTSSLAACPLVFGAYLSALVFADATQIFA